MKLALFFRGPVRINHAECMDNIRRVKEALSEHDIDDYLVSWDFAEAKELASKNLVKNTIILQEPDAQHVLSSLLTARQTDSHARPIDNVYKQFWTMRFFSKMILDTNIKYDYVFFCRADMRFDIIDKSVWFDPNHYVAPMLHNDTIGCATPQMFYDAWDYKDLETLNLLYSRSANPHRLWENIMNMNSVPYKQTDGYDRTNHPHCSGPHVVEYEFSHSRHDPYYNRK